LHRSVITSIVVCISLVLALGAALFVVVAPARANSALAYSAAGHPTGAHPTVAAVVDTSTTNTDGNAAIVAAIATATQTIAAARNASAIERDHVQTALLTVHATESGAAPWIDELGEFVPVSDAEFSVGFDNGQAGASGLPDSFGTRAAILTVAATGIGYVGAVFAIDGAPLVCAVPATIDDAAALLASIGGDMTCPGSEPPETASAITSMWAWGNSVDPAVDNRGLAEPGMAPAAIAAFAQKHGLSIVYLATPWAANEGGIASWLADTVDALHADGIRVAALGGDPSWLTQPALVTEWIADARAAASFDAVELDIEPWAGVASPDFSTITPEFASLLDDARAAVGPLSLGIDLPWWLTTESYGSGTVFDTLLSRVDTVAIVAFSNHADGTDGIVALAQAGATAVSAAGKTFTIGVETDTPAVAGGSQFTFFGLGDAALEAQCARVESAFESVSGYRGVSVEHLLSWEALIG
jgi:hypothetical protein